MELLILLGLIAVMFLKLLHLLEIYAEIFMGKIECYLIFALKYAAKIKTWKPKIKQINKCCYL